jgi:hypothetical protein
VHDNAGSGNYRVVYLEVWFGTCIHTDTYLGELCPTVPRPNVNTPDITLSIAKCKQVRPYICKPQRSYGTAAVIYDATHACRTGVPETVSS